MSIALDAIKSGLYNWIKDELADTAISPEKIIWEDQDGPRPARPYAVIGFVTGPIQVGHDEYREISPGLVNTTGNRQLSVSVMFLGKDSQMLACKLHSSLEKQTVRQGLYAKGLALVRQEDVQNVSLGLDTRIEQRFQFDVIFNCISSVEDNVGVIEQVELENEVLGTTEIIDGS